MDIFKTLLLDTPVSTAISGTVAINQGGTGATTAADARVNLLPSYTGNANKVLSLNSGATDVEWTTNGAGTVTSVDLTAGTGISVSGGPITSTGSITVTNTAPDQTVVLTQGGTTTITGSYPNFTISSADQYKGTVTSVDFSGGTTGLTVSGNPITSSGTITLAGTLAVANGGTGLTSGTSGGVLAFTASGTLASSSALTANALVVGGGAGAAPTTITTGTGVVTALGVNTGSTGAFAVDGAAATFTTLTATTKIVSPFLDASSSAGGALRNASGVAQVQWGAGGGSNVTFDVATNLNPANAAVSLAPTGTGTVTINPATAGTINAMSIGATTAASGKFTTLDATGNVGFDGGTFTFNDAGADKDFRIEGDTAANLFFSDASVDRIGINQGTPLARLDLNGNYASNITAVSLLDIDCSTANYFTKTIAADSTFTFSNPPSSRSFAFALELTHTSGAITWPAAVKWPKDTAPTLTTGKTHIFIFVTDDGGTRWRGAALVDYVN
jgi:hypothetical protein